MPYVHRTDQEIIAAWEVLLSKIPNPDAKVLGNEGALYSAREKVKGLSGPFKEDVKRLRETAKEHDDDPVQMLSLGEMSCRIVPEG